MLLLFANILSKTARKLLMVFNFHKVFSASILRSFMMFLEAIFLTSADTTTKRLSIVEKWNKGTLFTVPCPKNQLFLFSWELYYWGKIILAIWRNLSGNVNKSAFWDMDPYPICKRFKQDTFYSSEMKW